MLRLRPLAFLFLVGLWLAAPCWASDYDDHLKVREIPCYARDRFDPNVLIVLGTAGSMLFSAYEPGGTVFNPRQITRCPEDYAICTFGDGSSSFVQRLGSSVRTNDYRGRDVHAANNAGSSPENERLYYYNVEALGYPPNDSRLYQAKNALWKILTDPQLSSGIRWGLMTYYQEFVPQRYWLYGRGFNVLADFYKQRSSGCQLDGWACCGNIYSNSNGLTWGVDVDDWDRTGVWPRIRQGRLVVPIGSDSVSEILAWIDGVESPYNHSVPRYEGTNYELRADGPGVIGDTLSDLLASGFNHGGVSARRYFAQGVIQKEYHHLAGNQVQDGVWVSYPSPIQSPCQKNYVILIVDGLDYYYRANPQRLVDAVSHLMNVTYNGRVVPMKVYVVGFTFDVASPDHVLNRMARAGGTGMAYSARDPKELIEVLRRIALEIHRDAASTAPVVIPSRRREDGGSCLYVHSFYPRSFGQWRGNLYCYSLDQLSSPSASPLWNAASQLEEVSPTSRQVYLWSWFSNWRWNSLVRLSEQDYLQISAMNAPVPPSSYSQPPSDKASEDRRIIRFLLGFDEFGEDGRPTRHKLADAEGGNALEVGPPLGALADPSYRTFKEQNASRKPVVYHQTNDGMLHAFDAQTGRELWAFVPPMAVTFMGSLHTLDAPYSRPIRLLDGPVNAEDAQVGGEWRTVLVGVSGKAPLVQDPWIREVVGHRSGFYALALSSSQDQPPTFLWNVVNLQDSGGYAVNARGKVLVFKNPLETGLPGSYVPFDYRDFRPTLNQQSEHVFDYRFLGDLLCPPVVGYVPTDGGGRHWVVALISRRDLQVTGSDHRGVDSIYLVDLRTGRIVEREIFDFNIGSFPPSLKRAIKDNGAWLVAVAPPDAREGPRLTSVYFVSPSGNRVYLYRKRITTFDSSRWESEQRATTLWPSAQVLELREGNSPVGLPASPLEAARIGGDEWVFVPIGNRNYCEAEGYGRLIAANVSAIERSGSLPTLDALSKLLASEDIPSDLGWQMVMPQGERLLGAPVFYGGYVLWTTFRPSDDPCSVGRSYLYAVEVKSGRGLFGANTTSTGNPHEFTGRAISLGDVFAGGLSVRGGRVYITVSPSGTGAGLPSGFRQHGNVVVGELPPPLSTRVNPAGTARSVYWRED